jgi:hypothetical protein
VPSYNLSKVATVSSHIVCNTGVHNSGCHVARGLNFIRYGLTLLGPRYEISSCHFSGAYYFKVVPRCLESTCSLVIIYHIQVILTIDTIKSDLLTASLNLSTNNGCLHIMLIFSPTALKKCVGFVSN